MILFTADWHIKLGQKNVPTSWACTRYQMFYEQVQEAIDEHGVTLHIIGGDLFDRVPSMDELTLYFDFVRLVRATGSRVSRTEDHRRSGHVACVLCDH